MLFAAGKSSLVTALTKATTDCIVPSATVAKNLTSGKDELYSYDTLNRLTAWDRGDLDEPKTGLTGAAVKYQDWALDRVGNTTLFWDDSATATTRDADRHGIRQPKTLKERLRDNGYEDVAKHIHTKGGEIFLKEITLKAEK